MADNNHTDRVLVCLTDADEALTIRNITATTGLKTNDVKQALDALAAEGKVESAKVGRSEQWSLTTPEHTTADTADKDTGTEVESTDTPESGAEIGNPIEASGSDSEGRAEASTEDDSEAEEGVLLPAPKQVDPEVVFAATMLDQLSDGVEFSIESFTQLCGKTTPTERTRLLRSLWALAEHGLLDKSDPNDVDGGVWTVTAEGLAATVVAKRIQVTDAPEEIEVRMVKRMPWANGGTKAGRSRGDRVRGDTKPARARGELRVQIDAVLSAGAIEQPFTPAAVAEAVRAADAHHREADPNAVNNYLKQLQHGGTLSDATAETGQRAYRLA